MEILNSGSFIPLDNRERIEQLIFTAQTLASEVTRNAAFQSSGQTNQQIGLELWKGAEYMTRSHEEVTIRNIFLSKFLERLREIDRDQSQQPFATIPPPLPSTEISSTPECSISPPTQVEPESEGAGRDEFLGVIEDAVRPSYADECVPECEAEIASMLNPPDTTTVAEVSEETTSEPYSTTESREEPEATEEVTAAQIQTSSELSTAESTRDDQEETPSSGDVELPETEPNTDDKRPVNAVVLSEQEPYNFDACTVTAVIQLLPEVGGRRDSVISVRSHDFAPQIAFVDMFSGSGSPGISERLLAALEQYRLVLPALAAEKMKKEKSQSKKRVSKTTEKNPTTTDEKAGSVSGTTPATVPEQAKNQRTLFAS